MTTSELCDLPSPRGLFMVLEGIDGAGTTTQAERYAAYLRERGRRVHITREPTLGPIGSLIRLVLKHRVSLREATRAQTMALLFAADRLDHVEHEIIPMLASGCVVISDRYDLSSVAYQSVTSSKDRVQRSETAAWIRSLNRYAKRPDITLVLDVSPGTSAARRKARSTETELFDDAELQAELAAAYLRAEDLVPGDRLVHLNGEASPASVTQAIADAVDPLLGLEPVR